MRKNTARHWLHAGLDLLPLILIPVFMIYSHRHTIDSGSIEVPQNEVVDFNQNVDFINSNVDYELVLLGSYQFQEINFKPIDTNHKFYFKYETDSLFSNDDVFIYASDFLSGGVNFGISNNTLSNQSIVTSANSNLLIRVTTYHSYVIENPIKIKLNVYDLTKMFGSGNEPTIEQFNAWYPDDYYDYTLSHKELLKGYSTQTFDDTDIMSQFTYQLYNSVDKYFNMGNVFGMSNVYDWFNLNIFGGNASISIYIVWNIVLYEFVMDLLFLLYALFMWFIDVTKRLIEKPLDSIK